MLNEKEIKRIEPLFRMYCLGILPVTIIGGMAPPRIVPNNE